jgi:YaaC-like Protein
MESSMSQTAMPAGRYFDGWLRLPVSNNKILLLTTALDIEHELWSALEYYSEVEEVGLSLITKGLPPQSFHQEIFKNFQAFVRQAKSYYSSAKALHYRSSSLLYYYSFLNLVKAYLLLKEPQWIMGRTNQAVTHGLSYRPSTTNTDFQLERIRVRPGIFPLFYEAQTSNSISTVRNSSLSIINLLSYPTEIAYQYYLAGYGNNKILSSLVALVTDRLVNHQSWIIIGIPAATSFNDFLSLHINFLNTYQEVEIDKNRLASIFGMSAPDLIYFRFFQDIITIPMSDGVINVPVHREKIINTLNPYFSFHYFDDNKDFDLILPYTDATNPTPIPITEALSIYVVMFYLSSLVRYRPDYLEALLNYKPAWLIENFVNGTPETFLRIMVSKIVGIDFIFRRR